MALHSRVATDRREKRARYSIQGMSPTDLNDRGEIVLPDPRAARPLPVAT